MVREVKPHGHTLLPINHQRDGLCSYNSASTSLNYRQCVIDHLHSEVFLQLPLCVCEHLQSLLGLSQLGVKPAKVIFYPSLSSFINLFNFFLTCQGDFAARQPLARVSREAYLGSLPRPVDETSVQAGSGRPLAAPALP